MSCALLDLFKTVITNAFRKVLHGKQIRSSGLEVNGKIRDQRDDLIRTRMEMNKHCEVLVSCSNWVYRIDLIEQHACDKLSKAVISTACQL